jgi:hypothetical protein
MGADWFFGYTNIPGHGRTPKVYFIRRKGWEVLCNECDQISEFSEVNKEVTWTPQMYHRLKIIDLLIALELSLRTRPHLVMVNVFVEYRMVKRGGVMGRETTDFVDTEQVSENKLVPDAVFILENVVLQKRRLFFIEMDMGSERIVTNSIRDKRETVRHKFSQYDRYLHSKRYSQTYAAYGEFGFFIMLFVTLSAERLENIRREISDIPAELAAYYRFTTFDEAMGDFLGPVWKSRLISDTTEYSLVR